MSQPILYQINTRCWLRELCDRLARPITLAQVPDSELRDWQRLGFTHIWLMGIWEGGPRARALALGNPDQRRSYAEALPDWSEADIAASPYAVAAYRVSDSLGGGDALTYFRKKLHAYGLRLVLDFVPNHLGLDHPWVKERPEIFVQADGPAEGVFAQDTVVGKRFLAYGKDPNFPPWRDTVQVDYRRASTRAAMRGLLERIADRCDGVRCDMAMLLLNEVFNKTWNDFPLAEPPVVQEFWAEAIQLVRQNHPQFVFLAEVYWGLQSRLQAFGFDYTYDKALYDALISNESGAVQRHLLGLPSNCLSAGAHFLENHDESRIASILPLAMHRAAALLILGLPGMRFLHEGQLCGLRRRLPVQLIRRARESGDADIRNIYEQLLPALPKSTVGQGGSLLLTPVKGWADNPTAQNFILIQWTGISPGFDLVAVNLAPHPSQCFAPVQLPAVQTESWSVTDFLGPDRFMRDHRDLRDRGLYLDLPAYGGQILHFEPATNCACVGTGAAA